MPMPTMTIEMKGLLSFILEEIWKELWRNMMDTNYMAAELKSSRIATEDRDHVQGPGHQDPNPDPDLSHDPNLDPDQDPRNLDQDRGLRDHALKVEQSHDQDQNPDQSRDPNLDLDPNHVQMIVDLVQDLAQNPAQNQGLNHAQDLQVTKMIKTIEVIAVGLDLDHDPSHKTVMIGPKMMP